MFLQEQIKDIIIRARTNKRGTEKKEERESGAGTTTTAMGASWAWTGSPARHRRPCEDRRSGCTCSTVVRRGTARGSSYQRRHSSPKHRTGGWRRAVGCGSSRTRFSTDHASVRMSFKEMAPFFFRVPEPSAPTTLTSWRWHPVRTPTTARCVAVSHESRTPVSGGRRWDVLGDFGARNRALV